MNPAVTIVVSPRERFSGARASLESIYKYTDIPFSLVYVDGGSPAKLQHYLEAESRAKGFQLIRSEHYLSPNTARNLGLTRVTTKYVVFIDNDVIVSPDWLDRLIECSEETGATMVGPLTCIGTPLHQTVHCAGGEARIDVEIQDGQPRRRAHEKLYFADRPVAEIQDKLRREPTGLAEFHCMLVRTEIFKQVGSFDEGMLNTREHIDFSITVAEAGGIIYLEPTSVVTYVPGPPLEWDDIAYYMVRWSDAWELASLKRFRAKWDLTEDEFFKRRYKRLGWRRHNTLIRPLARKVSLFGQRLPGVERVLVPMDRALNRYLTTRHSRLGQKGQDRVLTSS